MLTRRRFLITLPAAAVASAANAQSFGGRFRRTPAPALPSFIYFGTDTGKGLAHGIYVARFDPATGHITPPQLAATTPRPSYMAISQPIGGVRRLYAVNDVANESATITAFAMNQASGALTQINQVGAGGSEPCYISLDVTGQMAFVADYLGSAVTTFHVEPNGGLSAPVARIDFKDAHFGKRGPNSAHQDAPHPSSAQLSPDNRFLLVSDLGSDAISIFPVEPGAHLGPPVVYPIERSGSGPRHIAFHPNGRWVYSLNELDCTVQRFLWTTTSSRTAPQALLVNTGEAVKLAAPESSRNTTAAELAISADGNFLYASIRGNENSIVVFSIDDAGPLTFLQRIPTGGHTPRQFSLDASGRWLACCNQESGTVTVFRRDGGSGKLSGPVQTIPLDSVLFLLFA